MRRFRIIHSERLHRTARIAVLCAIACVALQLFVSRAATAQSFELSAAEKRVQILYAQERFDDALRVVLEYLRQHPKDATMLYNAACLLALLDHPDEAMISLERSVQEGFRDLQTLQDDVDLDSLRKREDFITIVRMLSDGGEDAARMRLDRWKSQFGEAQYHYEVDNERRFMFATALDHRAHERMKASIQREVDHLVETFFEAPPDDYVLVAIPTPTDASKLLGADNIGGLYDHTTRQLISRNIGPSLRHEIFHVVHHAHMDRLDQDHPLWIQEGMASLYEDYDLHQDGTIRFFPNDRHNVARSQIRAGTAMTWSRLFKLNDDRFMQQGTQLYPLTRSIFRFVAERGHLQQWYQAYIKHFDGDATGVKAFEVVFEQPLRDTERAWCRWVLDQSTLDLEVRPGDPALGIACMENAGNDGALIEEILPRSSASRSSLRPGDVIVTVNERAVGSCEELVQIINGFVSGDSVDIRFRRNSQYLQTRLVLRPLQPAGVPY